MHSFESKESSNVGWARYDETKRILEVDFRDKTGAKQSTYKYENFPLELWLQFNASESKGRFFAFQIRPNFKGMKIWSR